MLTLSATILIEHDSAVIGHAAREIIGARTRAFHWTDEGPIIRQRAITCLIELGACAHVVVHHPTGRKRQERARNAALGTVHAADLKGWRPGTPD